MLESRYGSTSVLLVEPLAKASACLEAGNKRPEAKRYAVEGLKVSRALHDAEWEAYFLRRLAHLEEGRRGVDAGHAAVEAAGRLPVKERHSAQLEAALAMSRAALQAEDALNAWQHIAHARTTIQRADANALDGVCADSWIDVELLATECLSQLGKHSEAKTVAAAILSRASAAGLEQSNPHWAAAVEALRDALIAGDETTAAVSAGKRALAALKSCYGGRHHRVAMGLMALVHAEIEDVKFRDQEDSNAYLKKVITWVERQQRLRKNHMQRLATLEAAVSHAVEAESILEETDGRTSLPFIFVLGQRAEALSMLGRHTDALRVQAEAVRTSDLELGHSHEHTLREAAVLEMLTQKAQEMALLESDKSAAAAEAREVVRDVLHPKAQPKERHAPMTPDFLNHLPCSFRDCLNVETETFPFDLMQGNRAYCSTECQMKDVEADLEGWVVPEIVTSKYPRSFVKHEALDCFISKSHAELGVRVKTLAVARIRKGAYLLHNPHSRSLYVVVDEAHGVLVRSHAGWTKLDQYLKRAGVDPSSPQMLMCSEINTFVAKRFAVPSALQYE